MIKIRIFKILFVVIIVIISLLLSTIFFALVEPIITMRYSPTEGRWETEDGSAYLDFDLPNSEFGQVTVNGEVFLVYYWCYPRTPQASLRVVDDFSAESVHSSNGFAYLDMKFKKDYFIAKVTKSDFMEVGTVLTFYKVKD